MRGAEQRQEFCAMAIPSPSQLRDEGHHHPLTAPALDTKLYPAPANDITSKESGSDPWLPVQAAAG